MVLRAVIAISSLFSLTSEHALGIAQDDALQAALESKSVDEKSSGRYLSDLPGVVQRLTRDHLGHAVNLYSSNDSATQVLVVFVHGSPSTADTYTYQFDSPDPRARYVAYDRPGFGNSDSTAAMGNLEYQGLVLKTIVETYRVPGQKVIFVGASYGGSVFAETAVKYPGLYQGAITIGGAVDTCDCRLYWYNEFDHDHLLAAFIPWHLKQTNTEMKELMISLPLVAPHVGETHIPLHMIQGEDDSYVEACNVENTEQKFVVTGRAELFQKTYVPNSGHSTQYEVPEVVNGAISEMIDRVLRE